MAFGLFRPIIGVQCADGVLRAMLYRNHWFRGGEIVSKVCEVEVPSDLLTPEGLIKSPDEVGRMLRSELAKNGVSAGARAAVVLPVDRVYTHLLSLPVGPRRKLKAAVEAELERILPEDIPSLQVSHRVLTQSQQMMDVGIAAVSRNIVETYAAMVGAAGLRMEHMTTFPIALACCTDFSTFLLLVAPADGLRGTLTLVHEHWPIDEAMLPSGSTNAEILAEVRDMLADYQGRGVVPDHLVYVGEGELEQEVQRFAAAEGVVKIAVVKIAVRLLEPRLKHERVWSAPLVACFVPTGKIVVNFAP